MDAGEAYEGLFPVRSGERPGLQRASRGQQVGNGEVKVLENMSYLHTWQRKRCKDDLPRGGM